MILIFLFDSPSPFPISWICLVVFFFFFFKNARPETVTNDDEEALDEETKRRDQMIKGAIEVLIREYSSELNAPSQESDSHPRKKKKEKKEDVCVTDLCQQNHFYNLHFVLSLHSNLWGENRMTGIYNNILLRLIWPCFIFLFFKTKNIPVFTFLKCSDMEACVYLWIH